MLEGLTPPQVERLCPMISKAISTFDDKDLKIFMDALDGKEWTHPGLATALTSRGFKVSAGMIGHHRRKECSCAR